MNMDDSLICDPDQLPDDVGLLKQLVVGLHATVRERDQRIQSLEQSLHLLVKRFTHKKSEKWDPRQLQMFLQELQAAAQSDETPIAAEPEPEPEKKKARNRKPHGRGRLPETLTRETALHDLTVDQKVALGGDDNLVCIGKDVTVQLEWKPSALFVIEHQQLKYVLRKSVEAIAANEKAASTTSDLSTSSSDATEITETEPLNETAPQRAIEPQTEPQRETEPQYESESQSESEQQAEVEHATSESACGECIATVSPSASASDVSAAIGAIAALPLPEEKSIEAKYAALPERFRSLVIVAEKRDAGIPGCLAAPGLLAQVILSKYGDHLPLHRLERIFARQHVPVSRKTMCDWCASSAKLLRPLTELIREEVLKSFVIHTDDTPVKVRDAFAKQKFTARFWTYVGDHNHRLTWFEFTTTRKRAGPDRVLADFRGYLESDGYGGYDDYEGLEISDTSPILKVACWTHARRKFDDALRTEPLTAGVAIARIAQLYALEKEFRVKSATAWRDLSWEVRAELITEERQQRARPIVDAFKKWLDEQSQKALPKSPIAGAVRYALNQWDALYRYLDDGRLAIDNNVAERALRGIAIGRKNWMFCGSEKGGHTAAVLFTVIASALRNKLNPWIYLNDVLKRLPALGEKPTREQLLPLLPDRWKLPADVKV